MFSGAEHVAVAMTWRPMAERRRREASRASWFDRRGDVDLDVDGINVEVEASGCADDGDDKDVLSSLSPSRDMENWKGVFLEVFFISESYSEE